MGGVKTMMMLALLTLAAVPGRAQDNLQSSLRRVEAAISTGDYSTLTTMASDRLEIAVLGRSRQYSRSQGRLVLKEFFAEYPPRHFRFTEPSRTPRGLFVSGSYRHGASNQPLKVYARLRKAGSRWVLREILVENRGKP